MTEAERQKALDAIGAEVAACTRCRLHQTRTKSVPGEGPAETEVMFVGEGPGFNEDKQGRPFVGRAGDLLVKLLASIGWGREQVFIANVVKCRPPDNRDPEPDEIAACAPYLTRQIEALDPALIVTLGRFSMGRFNPGARIGQVHGTFGPTHPDSGAPDAYAFYMYHPAAALRDPGVETTSYADMRGVPAALLKAREIRAKRQAAVGSGAPASSPAPSSSGGSAPQSAGGAYLAEQAAIAVAAAFEAFTATISPGPEETVATDATTESSQPEFITDPYEQASDSDPTDQLGLF